jgi:hypothetical protein
MVSRSISNLKIDTIYMYDIPFDRSFLQLSNGVRHVMPSTDTKPELTAKASMAQPVSQPAVYANGLIRLLENEMLDDQNYTECLQVAYLQIFLPTHTLSLCCKLHQYLVHLVCCLELHTDCVVCWNSASNWSNNALTCKQMLCIFK